MGRGERGGEVEDVSSETAAWLIWSGEHKAWWRPDARGYSEFVGDAGRYTRDEAQAWLDHAGAEKLLEVVPDPYGPCSTETFTAPAVSDVARSSRTAA